MNEIRHIVFDIGKVLIHYDPDLPFSRLIPDAEERRWFLENVCTNDWNIEQDRGRSWRDAEDLLIAAHPDYADNIRNFRRYWHEMVPHAYGDSVAIMERLIAAGHDVTMLTNFAADTFAEARTRYPFLQRPRGVTVSGEVGMIKPDRDIYRPSRCHVRAGPIRNDLHRRQPSECRRSQGCGMAGCALSRRQNARGRPRAFQDRTVTGRTADR